MAAPKDFSQDGAVGSGGGGTSSPASSPGSSWAEPMQAGNAYQAPNGAMMEPAAVNTSLGGFDFSPGTSWGGGYSFDQGGAVPDTGEDGDSDGSPGQDMMAKALQSVDATLQYSYQKYGLGGGQQEAANMPARPGSQSEYPGGGTYGPGGSPPPPQQQAGMMPTIPGNQSETPGPYQPGTPSQPPPQQMASNMPAVPGSQSNSGIPAQQPMPGPLPPTSNPFGKRTADAGGAIDTDDEAA